MTQPGSVVIQSTKDLTPDGLAGYFKFIAGFVTLLGGALAVVLPLLDADSTWARWVGGAVAVLGWLGVYGLPNAFKPVTVAPPVTNLTPEAQAEAAPVTDPDPLLGVVDPPGKHEAK